MVALSGTAQFNGAGSLTVAVPQERWLGGLLNAGLAWTNAFSTGTLNSIANGNAILSDLMITNDGWGDMFCDLSLNLTSAVFASPNYVSVYLYPGIANKQFSVFGDGRFSTAAAGPPPSCYWVGDINLVAATQAQAGTLTRIPIPPGTFKFVLWNQGGVTWSTSNLCQYRSYNLQLG